MAWTKKNLKIKRLNGYTDQEWKWITKTWRASVMDARTSRDETEARRYLSKLRRDIIRTLHDPSTQTFLVLDTSEPEDNNFIAFISFSLEPVPVLHMIYVKYLFRQIGIGGALMKRAFNEAAPILFQYETGCSKHYQDKWNLVSELNLCVGD